MRAEPYICKTGPKAGEIQWKQDWETWSENWQRYVDFEREKLRELDGFLVLLEFDGRYMFRSRFDMPVTCYDSQHLIGYSEYLADTESNRLLKRAEFLKAVCEKVGVEWLPDPAIQIEKAKVSVGDDEGSLEDCGEVSNIKIEPARSCGCEGDDEACSECTPKNGHIFFNGEVVPCKCQTVTVNYVHNDDGSMTLDSIDLDPEEPCDGKNCGNLEAGDDCDQVGCGCGCHNLGAAGCPGCADNCPDKIRKYGSNLGSPDCYSKQEIDSALEQLERRVDQKASQLVGLLQKDTYSREEIDSRFANL